MLADCWVKLSSRPMGRLAILRKSGAGWGLDSEGLFGQAFQTDRGRFGQLEGVGGGLATGLRWMVGPSFQNGPRAAWSSRGSRWRAGNHVMVDLWAALSKRTTGPLAILREKGGN